MSKTLQGGKLAGGNPELERVVNDYYATAPKTTQDFLNALNKELKGSLLECACGEGYISEVLKDNYPQLEVVSRDLVDYGYEDLDKKENFLESDENEKFDYIMTNPPFNLIDKFILKGMNKLKQGGKLILFAKIQLLESEKRRTIFEKYPPKYIYVYSKRAEIWRAGEPLNPKTNKKWASTMTFAWFIWEDGYKGEPTVRWI